MNNATVDQLRKHFDLALEAPDGIKRLRELILTMAMQGKLVPQDPNDQPANELLIEIEAEKKRLVKEGKIKAPKPLPEIRPEDVPFAVPKGWEWVRLGEICNGVTSGSTPPADEFSETNGVPFLKVYNIRNQKIDFEYKQQYVSETYAIQKLKRSNLFPGDVIMNIVGPPLGKVAIIPSNFPMYNCNQAIVFFRPYISEINRYIYAFLLAGDFLNRIELIGTAGQDNISVSKSNLIEFPLPPLAEQKRIVAKIDQLMATCDALEQLRNSRQQKRLDIHTAAITRLLDAQNPAEADSAWAFLQQHFGELYGVKENVAELRKAILQLAVMGKLVPQDPNDKPASELLKEIEAEKRRLVKEGKIKAPKPLPEIQLKDVPYVVPKGWEWVRLGEVASFQTGKLDSNAAVINGEYPFFTCSREPLQIDFYDFDCETILLAGNNAAGRFNVKHYKGKFNAYQRTYVITLEFGRSAAMEYLYLENMLNKMLDELQEKSVGTLTRFLTMGILLPFIIPLPPLAEQKRIVAKIDQLMALCDSLEQGLEAATQKQSAVLGAVLAQV